MLCVIGGAAGALCELVVGVVETVAALAGSACALVPGAHATAVEPEDEPFSWQG